MVYDAMLITLVNLEQITLQYVNKICKVKFVYDESFVCRWTSIKIGEVKRVFELKPPAEMMRSYISEICYRLINLNKTV
jgi:hypothetical protein